MRDNNRSPKPPRAEVWSPSTLGPPWPVAASVIIPSYTLDRWSLLCDAVHSVQVQTRPPLEIIICVDHNADLFARCTTEWPPERPSEVPIRIIENRFEQDPAEAEAHLRAHGSRRRFGAGWARNCAAELARGDVLAFLDDDAAAAPAWLAHLLAPYDEPSTIAVGGAPLPRYETERPGWFPPNFDWVFGCAYDGLPSTLAPAAHLIGANMSVRRTVFEAVGGFHSIDFDDLDLCMRIAAQYPNRTLYYEPLAVVFHYVPEGRLSWHYFWRRCFFVNREKVETFAAMGQAANLNAERAFVRRALITQVATQLAALRSGQRVALLRLGSMVVGIVMAVSGHLVGQAHRLSSRLFRWRFAGRHV